jgi:hypothetical protein
LNVVARGALSAVGRLRGGRTADDGRVVATSSPVRLAGLMTGNSRVIGRGLSALKFEQVRQLSGQDLANPWTNT